MNTDYLITWCTKAIKLPSTRLYTHYLLKEHLDEYIEKAKLSTDKDKDAHVLLKRCQDIFNKCNTNESIAFQKAIMECDLDDFIQKYNIDYE